jgi:predicted nucleic acid binding AN1-type Zn finger protein
MTTKFFASIFALALAGTALSAPAFAEGDSHWQAPQWLAGVSGSKFTAVDGSAITLTADDDGLTVDNVSAAGNARQTYYNAMSDKLGTVSDDIDAHHLLGLYRQTDMSFEVQYSDGHSETLGLNSAGGVSLIVRDGGSTSCTAWYPSDHVFSEADRRAALAAYANKLGLSAPVSTTKKGAQAPASSCTSLTRAAQTTAPIVSAQKTVIPAVAHSTPHTRHAADTTVANSSDLVPMLVHTSDVHTIDSPESIANPPPDHVSRVAPTLTAQSPQPPAQKAPTLTQVALKTNEPAGHGASDCLSVDSDGSSVGFRNACSYNVQFSFCLQKATDPELACDAGTETGNVAPNTFAPLLLDTNIKTSDAEHDFRWVACSGNKGEVEARLDHVDPPAGRCVRVNAS